MDCRTPAVRRQALQTDVTLQSATVGANAGVSTTRGNSSVAMPLKVEVCRLGGSCTPHTDCRARQFAL